MFNKGYSVPADADAFMVEHVQGDWKVLKKIVRKSDDDLALLVHATFVDIAAAANDSDPNPTTAAVAAPVAGAPLPSFVGLSSIEARSSWESEVIKILSPQFGCEQLQERLDELYAFYSEGYVRGLRGLYG